MPGHAAPDPDVEVIEGSGPDTDQGLACGWDWVGNVRQLQGLRASMSPDDDGSHKARILR